MSNKFQMLLFDPTRKNNTHSGFFKYRGVLINNTTRKFIYKEYPKYSWITFLNKKTGEIQKYVRSTNPF